jgi:hypothetical protein
MYAPSPGPRSRSMHLSIPRWGPGRGRRADRFGVIVEGLEMYHGWGGPTKCTKKGRWKATFWARMGGHPPTHPKKG